MEIYHLVEKQDHTQGHIKDRQSHTAC